MHERGFDSEMQRFDDMMTEVIDVFMIEDDEIASARLAEMEQALVNGEY